MITGKLVTQCTTDSDMISSEGSSNLFEDLRVLDDSPHGVSMVSLCPHNIDLAAVKVPTIGLVFCSNPFNKNMSASTSWYFCTSYGSLYLSD